MMTRCVACDGTKHRYKEVMLPEYKSPTLVYCGPCNVCDVNGKVWLSPDAKQHAAGDKDT